MTKNRDTVITGLGVFSPIGIGLESFWTALCEGRSGIRSLPLFDDPGLPTPMGGQVVDFDPKQYVRPRKSLKVMNRDIQLGFAAADMACEQAGLHAHAPDPERFGVVLGADMMPCDLDELITTYTNCIVDGRYEHDRWGHAFPGDLFPLWMLKYLPNMPACHIGIAQDARGPNNTITIGEVSTLSAISEACRVLERGHVDAMIAGGVSSRTHPALWTRQQVIGQSQRFDDPQGASRPFDADRDGIVPGEGSGAVVLESAARAKQRGANILARVLGYATSFEPHAKGQPLQGTAMRHAIALSLETAELKPADVGCVVAHGASTRDGDRIEAQAIHDMLGDVPVTAPKSLYGHLGAAAGSLEMAVSVLSLQHGQIPPTLNYQRPDPECPVRVVRGGFEPLKHSTALILAHSRHGQAAAIVLDGSSA